MRDYPDDVRTAMDELLGRDRVRLAAFGLVAGGLLSGFVLGQGLGMPTWGGLVMAVAGVVAAAVMWRAGARAGIAIAGVTYVVAFGLAHPLGLIVGAVPAVVLAALVAGAVTFECTPRGRRVPKMRYMSSADEGRG